MSQSFSALFVHIVFSTKLRKPFLRNRDLRLEMHSYLGGVSKNQDTPPLLIGGTEDHIHALCQLGRSMTAAGLIKEMKRSSSLWIKEREPALSDFAWQTGYGIFSVSSSKLDAVRAYINDQEEHHKKQTFQDELRLLLRKHGLEWDERYIWE